MFGGIPALAPTTIRERSLGRSICRCDKPWRNHRPLSRGRRLARLNALVQWQRGPKLAAGDGGERLREGVVSPRPSCDILPRGVVHQARRSIRGAAGSERGLPPAPPTDPYVPNSGIRLAAPGQMKDAAARSPRFLGNPRALMPGSSTPAGPTCQAITACRRGPRTEIRQGLPRRKNFRGSIAGPRCWLSTLRGVGYPTAARKTRFRLLASATGWDWLPTGLRQKVSVMLRPSRPPFPSFSWRKFRFSCLLRSPEDRAVRTCGLSEACRTCLAPATGTSEGNVQPCAPRKREAGGRRHRRRSWQAE